jgi:hypothetical protein
VSPTAVQSVHCIASVCVCVCLREIEREIDRETLN